MCVEKVESTELIEIKGALHTETMAKHEGRKAVAQFLESVSDGERG